MSSAGTEKAIRWNESYRVNIAVFDRQHQSLFNTINELNDALAAGHGATAIDHVLQKLLEYAKNHFASEEFFMEAHHYPGLAAHRLEHQAFARSIDKYVDDHKKGKSGVPVSLLLFLQTWLREHILKTDKAYGAFLNDHGVR
jgi:hemerythrin